MLLVAPRPINRDARPAFGGGILERDLCPAQQGRRAVAVIGKQAHTAGDVQVETDAGQMKAATHDTGQLLCIERRTLATAILGNDQELRFAETRNGVGSVCILTEPAGGFP